MAAADKGAGPAKPGPQAAKKAPAKKAEEPKAESPKPIGVEPVIRVGGHVITDDGWTPEEES